MGEASACLMPSFSQPSPISGEETNVNPLQQALTTSISFGRFMSESLDWEKRSAFTHNRYLEEAEKYSKPGTVAEKKAYFEAHFKRRRAAALLEQQNAASSNLPETNKEQKVEKNSTLNSGLVQRDSLVTEKMKEEEIQSSDHVGPVGQNDNYDASVEVTSEDAKPGGTEKVSEQLVTIENPLEITNHLENDECTRDIASKLDDKLLDKGEASPRKLASGAKKPEVSFSKLAKNDGASDCESPFKVIRPVQLKNSEKTPESKSKKMDLGNKRRSYTTLLHMPINFARKDATPGFKTDNPRIARAPAKKYKNSALPRTSAKASANDLFKYSAMPSAENSRKMRPHGDPISGARTADEKVPATTSIYSKSSILSGIRVRTPTVPSSFTFKSEERAVRRREFFQKLEQKTKSETEKHKVHANPQVKARSTTEDLPNSIALGKANNEEFLSRTSTKKAVPAVRSCLPKNEERTPFRIRDHDARPPFIVRNNDSRPPWRISAKTEGSKDFARKNSRPQSHSVKSVTKKSVNENASPNIQLG